MTEQLPPPGGQWEAPLIPAQNPEPGGWWKRRRVQVWVALGTALALIAGLVVWLIVPGGAAQDKEPFYRAVASLSVQPVVRYSGTAPDGARWDLDITDGGEQIGTVTPSAGLTTKAEQVSVLAVGGKVFVKPPPDLLADLPSTVPPSAVQGKWVTGDDSLTGILPQDLQSPLDIAATLWSGLDQTAEFPKVGDPTAVVSTSTGAQQALRVATPDGVLYVSAAAPYRVLRLERPQGSAAGASAATGPAGGTARLRSGYRIVDAGLPRTAASDGLSGLARADFTPVSSAEADRIFGDLRQQTKSLSGAVDLGVTFDFNHTGNLNCSDANCTVTENVTTSTSSGAANATLSGTVTANMTATVTVNGMPGGGCAQTGSLPINGGGVITCDDPGVAPAVAQIKAEKQAEADAQAAANPGQYIRIPYSLDFLASVQMWAVANVQAEIDQEVQSEQDEQKAADRAPDNADDSCALDIRGGSVLGVAGATDILALGSYGTGGVLAAALHDAGGSGPCRLGQAGESGAGITKNTRKLLINGRTRIPDELTPTTIGEVKNVSYQYLSTQLKDDLDYAQSNGLRFNLYVRSGTRLSGPLQDLVDLGKINLIRNLP